MDVMRASWNGTDQSEFCIVIDLWKRYIGTPDSSIPYTQKLDMLQESIRRCMRSEYELYLIGKVSAGLVSETKGHAVLICKIKAHEARRQESVSKVKGAQNG